MQGTCPPNQLSAEYLLWSGLSFDILSSEEMARQQAAVEDKVHFYRDVWWKAVKPFFYIPCRPLAQVDHHTSWPDPVRALAGFTHLVPLGSPSNGTYPAIIYENVHDYSLSKLPKPRRLKIRKALTQLNVRKVEHLSDLLNDGYETYVSWQQRNGWGKNKTEYSTFENWISRAFAQPKQVVLNAYLREKLIAFMLAHVVDNVATTAFVASNSAFHQYCPNDALFQAFLCISRQTPGVSIVDFGPVSNKPSLDTFKLTYGTIKQFSSDTWITPLLYSFCGEWIKRRYPWLRAQSRARAQVRA
jgi:hypothetical protein